MSISDEDRRLVLQRQAASYAHWCPQPYVHFLSTGLNDSKHLHHSKACSHLLETDNGYHAGTQQAVNMYHYVATQGGRRNLEGLKILEIACGKGAAAYLVKHDCGAAEYVGIDLCPNFITTANHEFNNDQGVNFIIANACELPSRFDNHFDMVICLDSAHGFGGERGMFNALGSLVDSVHKVLRQGGLFMFEDVAYKEFHPDLETTSKTVAANGFEVIFEEELTEHIAWPEESRIDTPINECHYLVGRRI